MSEYVYLSNGEEMYKIFYNRNDKVSSIIQKLRQQYQSRTENGIILIYGVTPLDENKRIGDYNIKRGKRIKYSDAYNGGISKH